MRDFTAGLIPVVSPQDERNLPEGWRDVDPKLQFLYMLLLAVDVNFRLKNRMRLNEIEDPSLGPGWGYWVEPKKYTTHLRKYVNEKDISTCIVFAALLQKDTRMTTGLRVSGVGGCVCAQHECMRPNGLGDLQKGERYANMDFIVMSALAGFTLMLLTLSYDIACQWKLNLRDRMVKLPTDLRLDLDAVKLQCALPVWHAASHNEACANANSLSFKEGVGKSDGEGVERMWSVLNPAAYATKDAGRGQRADGLEAKIDNHNYLKNVSQGDTLARKLVVAIVERDKQVAAFKVVTSTIESGVKKEWRGMIDAWLKDASQPNPYILTRKDCPTEAERKGAALRAQCHSVLTAGIQIEDAQRRIVAEVAGTVVLAADRDNRIQEWRHALLVKIEKYRNLQKIYMPSAARSMEEADGDRDPDAAPPKPERVKLFMPSQMVPDSEGDMLRGCIWGPLGMEAKLRIGQCNNSLASMRSRLHAKWHLIGFQDENVTGQIQSTKARSLIGEVGERVQAFAKRYRHGREALLALEGAEAYPRFRELKANDIRLDGDAGESDVAARKKLGIIGVSVGRAFRGMRRGRRTPGALDDEEEQIHESVRVEWCRAGAQKSRWMEESRWWRARVESRPDASSELAAGLCLYALKQAAWHDRLASSFHTKWTVPVGKVSRGLLNEGAEDAPDFELELDQLYSGQ
ncbi:hypothetical protein DFH09DRAFT_1375122 [Mycena vulgaris]|nr:hypothetical protein DFH09DRAFT_1375122 [Mycena vulgaris]